jgi:hypothetical protein
MQTQPVICFRRHAEIYTETQTRETHTINTHKPGHKPTNHTNTYEHDPKGLLLEVHSRPFGSTGVQYATRSVFVDQRAEVILGAVILLLLGIEFERLLARSLA